jgi:hypothetical protein
VTAMKFHHPLEHLCIIHLRSIKNYLQVLSESHKKNCYELNHQYDQTSIQRSYRPRSMLLGWRLNSCLNSMPRYRCPSCCCGPALVLRPPKGAVPICGYCQTPLEKQPMIKLIPFMVLLAVGSVLVASSFPLLFEPKPQIPLKRSRQIT